MPKRLHPSLLAALLFASLFGSLCMALPARPATAAPVAEPSSDSIAALVAGLGDADYHRREAAAAALKALGPAAVDALLAAAELSQDLEVSLRARWLVEAIPLEMPHDPPEVIKLLERFKRRDAGARSQALRRLLRVDNDAGIEPLARIVRLDRSANGSRLAAALLVREWQPDDPFWKELCPKIMKGIGASDRPTASFLRSLIAFSQSPTPAEQAESLAAAAAALTALASMPADAGATDRDAGTNLVGETHWIFARCRMQMLLAAGRPDEAVAAARQMLADCFADRGKDPETLVAETVEMLAWATEHGLADAVDALAERPELIRDHAVVGFTAAAAEQARGNLPKAESLAADAFEKTTGNFAGRLQAAILLVKWGCVDWANRAYAALVEDPQAPIDERSLAAIMYSEFLHDHERHDEAARCLGRIVAAAEENNGNPGPLLQQLGRDSRTMKSRMHFFEACAATQRGDAAGRRRAAEQAVAAYPKDVDALIALYTLPDNTPEQKAEAVKRIKTASAQIESEIQAVPDDANGYNEFAWLVANTEGDVVKATKYSKFSLARSFDSASYLDTLAHCRAASGDFQAAIRTQLLARRQEPHNRTIQRNLARFEKLAAEQPPR